MSLQPAQKRLFVEMVEAAAGRPEPLDRLQVIRARRDTMAFAGFLLGFGFGIAGIYAVPSNLSLLFMPIGILGGTGAGLIASTKEFTYLIEDMAESVTSGVDGLLDLLAAAPNQVKPPSERAFISRPAERRTTPTNFTRREILTLAGLKEGDKITRDAHFKTWTNYTARYEAIKGELFRLGWIDSDNVWTVRGERETRG